MKQLCYLDLLRCYQLAEIMQFIPRVDVVADPVINGQTKWFIFKTFAQTSSTISVELYIFLSLVVASMFFT